MKERGKENEMEIKGRRAERWKKRRRRVERWKRGQEEKGMERVCAKGKKKGRMRCGRKEERKKEKNEGEREREEMRGRERLIENRESSTRNLPPSPDAFPSTKLGNNMTPIKGRLGKNTTPTRKGSTKMNQNLQVDPRRRRSSFEASFRADLNYVPEGQSIRSINSIVMKPPFIRRPKHSKIRAIVSNSP